MLSNAFTREMGWEKVMKICGNTHTPAEKVWALKGNYKNLPLR